MEDAIWLQRPNEEVPWGFRLQGGRDFQQPLSVQKVTSGSIAANSLNSGDVILRIGDSETASLSHAQAMSKIKSYGNTLELGISRSGLSCGITSPKVGSYSVQPQSDALHDISKSIPGVWPQTNPVDSPRNAPHILRLSSTDSDISWQPKPGFGRQYSGSNAPNATIRDASEPLFDAYHHQEYTAAPAVVVDDPEGPTLATGQDTITNPPPPPPPPPPPSSPSSASRPWNKTSNISKTPQQKSHNHDTSNEYSSSYPFGAPSNYSSDSGFGRGSPVSNGQQATPFGGYGGDYDLNSPYSDAAGQTQEKAKATPPQRMPDAILNMAAKGEGDKKPFSYVADVNDIKEHRDRVRKKNPVCSLPKYQHVLNLPQFEDPPRARGALRTPATPPIQNPDSGEAVVSNLQFNSPLQMYSNDNVVEALKGQTGGKVNDVVGLSKKDDKTDITKSAVYKMIHGIDQPKPKSVVKFAEAQPTASENVGGSEIDTTSIRSNVKGDDSDPGSYDEKSIRYIGKNIPSKSFRLLQSMTGGPDGDSTPPTVRRQIREPPSEVRFSGTNRPSDVPSKTFQRLQIRSSPTPGASQGGPQGGSEIDRTSIRQNLNLGDDLQDAGDYEQTSIRYTGRNIPSKSFRMLQSLTGDSGSESPPPGSRPRRQQMRPQQQTPEGGEKQNPDEPVDIRYVGGNIPSQSFKMLQHSIGANDSAIRGNVDGSCRGDTLASSQGRHVKVVRLRQQSSQEDSGSTDF